MIRALLFDIGNVIVPVEPRRAWDLLAPHCPLTWDVARRRLFASEEAVRFECGALSPDEFLAGAARLLEIQAPTDVLREAWCSMFGEGTLLPAPLFASLARSHRLVLVSNTNVLHFEAHRVAWPHFGYFHAAVLSYRAGCRKPAREFFEQAVAAAQCPAQECLYIDDSQEYVTAARALGIPGIVFTGEAALRSELDRRGVPLESAQKSAPGSS
ncbi:MAG TPA: hypothetical protein DEH78_17945 [Solibacterales bacterium]|nr:hypothetical protein [Bryobacterales bacterium]